ncbi:MAG: hypothetical protein WCT10_05235 [Patescibacteria group bacterium]|jgi:hypothetical protein
MKVGESGAESIGLLAVVREPTSSPRLEDCAIVRRSFFRRKYGCGHRGPKLFAFSIWGSEVRLIDEFLLQNEECPVCLLTRWQPQIIRCPDCEQPIIPGDPVVLPCRDERDDGKDWLVVVPGDSGGDQVVCCPCGDNCLGLRGQFKWNGSAVEFPRTDKPDK